MATNFYLRVEFEPEHSDVEFHLLDARGSLLASPHHVDIAALPASRQQGLFDLQDYLQLCVEPARHDEEIAAIGVSIAQKLLGDEIFAKLWGPVSHRTLCIQLPGAEAQDHPLAAAMARVPWELARPGIDQKTLAQRNLSVRIEEPIVESISKPLELEPNKYLRVLFVFAAACGSQPLAARAERLALQKLLKQEIYPVRLVTADFLTHGVTRERLIDQLQGIEGYHLIHWSGHGHRNLLELSGADGRPAYISGEELLDLLVDAGGFLPQLVFLSSCFSGAPVIDDWSTFIAAAQGLEPRHEKGTRANSLTQTTATEPGDLSLSEPSGLTGTASALLQNGVPTVVAMRFAVGDEYARDLAVAFYRNLLAHKQPKDPATALNMARRSLLTPKPSGDSCYAAADHATPVVFGSEQPSLPLQEGQSRALDVRRRRLHAIGELSAESHAHFVGRTWELNALLSRFLGVRGSREITPVAVIQGLGGMGKSALVAEALALWENRFKWVLLYQAKPSALNFEATLRDIHFKLDGELGRYHNRVKQRPAEAIYRVGDEACTGADRLDRLMRNLCLALQDEPILLVLDNFESNLRPQPSPVPDGPPLWSCQDPAFDRCLQLLAKELVNCPSRLLITSRRPLEALASENAYQLHLGPLQSDEAALYLRSNPTLRQMVLGGEAQKQQLARRLLEASRFHPLLMDRLARLAGTPGLRPKLFEALQSLEQKEAYENLPDLLARSGSGVVNRELNYLSDALTTTTDQLIGWVSPGVRNLLWIIALANDPLPEEILEKVWSHPQSIEQDQMAQCIEQLLGGFELPTNFPEFLSDLVGLGLVSETYTFPEDETPLYACHELVRERMVQWMDMHPEERGNLTQRTVLISYAECFETICERMSAQNIEASIDAGVKAVIYFAQAEAFERVLDIVGRLLMSSHNPILMKSIIPYLQTSLDDISEGLPRIEALSDLGLAYTQAHLPHASLTYFQEAAQLAQDAILSEGEEMGEAQQAFVAIYNNWGSALIGLNMYHEAKEKFIEAIELAERTRKFPPVDIIGFKLELQRIAIKEGNDVEPIVAVVENHLSILKDWLDRHLNGEDLGEAPDHRRLFDVYVTGLDVAEEIDYKRNDWKSALLHNDIMLRVMNLAHRSESDLHTRRVLRASVLIELDQLPEAYNELQECSDFFEADNDDMSKALALNGLARLFSKNNDHQKAIDLEHRALIIYEGIFDLGNCTSCHTQLARYFKSAGSRLGQSKGVQHQLAAFIYSLCLGGGQLSQILRKMYFDDCRNAMENGEEYIVPSVVDLLADSDFTYLKWLVEQNNVDISDLQTKFDQMINYCRQQALASP